jgi:predicted enzyme related to lactoylglutathione lyase
MTARFDLVTIDAKDAALLVSFWSAALGLHITETEDDGRWTVLGDTLQHRRIGIQRIADLATSLSRWEGESKVRIHLDLVCDLDEFATEVARLIQLGASRLRDDRVEGYGSIATLADPEGNLFDLCAYL